MADAVVVRQVERRHREGRPSGMSWPARWHSADSAAAYLAARCWAALSHIQARAMMITMTKPNTTYGAVSWVSSRQARTVAISRIQTMDTGMRTFQPIAISWS